MDESTRDILKVMRKRLEAPERWAKGSFSLNAVGELVLPRSKDAICWCLLGAVYRDVPHAAWEPCVQALTDALPPEGRNLTWFNDEPGTTHADIMALFDRALAS